LKRIPLAVSLALLSAPLACLGQIASSSAALVFADPSAEGGGQVASPAGESSASAARPFSRFAVGAGTSTLGIHMFAATNANRHLDLRANGDVFSYSRNNISISDFNVNFNLNMASAGVSADFYPFPIHGFRLSPGLLFYNQNGGTGAFAAAGGSSFTLNHVTYYSSTTNPVEGAGSLGLNSQNPAFTITTGWGRIVHRPGGHWSFPSEIGVALIGAPSVNVALNSGQVCNATNTGCVNVATDANVQSNLQAQVAKYKNDLNPLKTYPILQGGVAYTFGR
jgi:hypothetical protein